MSQSRVEKLNALLTRVQQRRNEPRLVALAGVSAPTANTNLAQPQLELAKPLGSAPRKPSAPELGAVTRPALTPIEDAIAPSAPSSIPPPSPPSSIPPPSIAARTPVPPAKPPSSTVPPSETLARAATEILPAAEGAPERVAPSPALPFDSAVRVTSPPRIEAPKTFGELLELSLALRPKAG